MNVLGKKRAMSMDYFISTASLSEHSGITLLPLTQNPTPTSRSKIYPSLRLALQASVEHLPTVNTDPIYTPPSAP
jgi:hypothetical protein